MLPRTVTPPDPANLGVYRQSTGEWFVLEPSGVVNVTLWGTATLGDRPVRADYDGDGKADIAVFRPTSGAVVHPRLSRRRDRSVLFGGSGPRTSLPADYDGDGKADLAVFRQTPGSGSSSAPPPASPVRHLRRAGFGDIPVPADYDGDGKADLAVFRVAPAQWFILRPRQGFAAPSFGHAGLGRPSRPTTTATARPTSPSSGRHGAVVHPRLDARLRRPVPFGSAGLATSPSRPTTTATARPTSPSSAATGQWFIFGSSAGFGSPVLFGAPSLGDVPITQRTMSP